MMTARRRVNHQASRLLRSTDVTGALLLLLFLVVLLACGVADAQQSERLSSETNLQPIHYDEPGSVEGEVDGGTDVHNDVVVTKKEDMRGENDDATTVRSLTSEPRPISASLLMEHKMHEDGLRPKHAAPKSTTDTGSHGFEHRYEYHDPVSGHMIYFQYSAKRHGHVVMLDEDEAAQNALIDVHCGGAISLNDVDDDNFGVEMMSQEELAKHIQAGRRLEPRHWTTINKFSGDANKGDREEEEDGDDDNLALKVTLVVDLKNGKHVLPEAYQALKKHSILVNSKWWCSKNSTTGVETAGHSEQDLGNHKKRQFRHRVVSDPIVSYEIDDDGSGSNSSSASIELILVHADFHECFEESTVEYFRGRPETFRKYREGRSPDEDGFGGTEEIIQSAMQKGLEHAWKLNMPLRNDDLVVVGDPNTTVKESRKLLEEEVSMRMMTDHHDDGNSSIAAANPKRRLYGPKTLTKKFEEMKSHSWTSRSATQYNVDCENCGVKGTGEVYVHVKSGWPTCGWCNPSSWTDYSVCCNLNPIKKVQLNGKLDLSMLGDGAADIQASMSKTFDKRTMIERRCLPVLCAGGRVAGVGAHFGLMFQLDVQMLVSFTARAKIQLMKDVPTTAKATFEYLWEGSEKKKTSHVVFTRENNYDALSGDSYAPYALTPIEAELTMRLLPIFYAGLYVDRASIRQSFVVGSFSAALESQVYYALRPEIDITLSAVYAPGGLACGNVPSDTRLEVGVQGRLKYSNKNYGYVGGSIKFLKGWLGSTKRSTRFGSNYEPIKELTYFRWGPYNVKTFCTNFGSKPSVTFQLRSGSGISSSSASHVLGTFFEMDGKKINGKSVYKSSSHADRYLFYSNDNSWSIGKEERMKSGEARGWTFSTSRNALYPSYVGAENWKLWHDKKWHNDAITITFKNMPAAQAATTTTTFISISGVWLPTPLGECSASCGGGYQMQRVDCVVDSTTTTTGYWYYSTTTTGNFGFGRQRRKLKQMSSYLSDSYCDPALRPSDYISCNTQPCPAPPPANLPMCTFETSSSYKMNYGRKIRRRRKLQQYDMPDESLHVLGTYYQDSSLTSNGLPVYHLRKSDGTDRFLFYSNYSSWIVGSNALIGSDRGYVFSSSEYITNPSWLPYNESWSLWYNDEWYFDILRLTCQNMPSAPPPPKVYCAPGCYLTWIGDGYCDLDCYNADCNFDANDCTFSYVPGNWTACSCSGIRFRAVQCMRSDGTIVSESYCSGMKPSSSESCTTQQSCASNLDTSASTCKSGVMSVMEAYRFAGISSGIPECDFVVDFGLSQACMDAYKGTNLTEALDIPSYVSNLAYIMMDQCGANATNTTGACSAACPDFYIGDGECDDGCNVAACGWDGGDCSQCEISYLSCSSGYQSCSTWGSSYQCCRETSYCTNAMTPTTTTITFLEDGSYWPSTCECMPGYLNGACHCIPCEKACRYDSPEILDDWCLGSDSWGGPAGMPGGPPLACPPPSTWTTTLTPTPTPTTTTTITFLEDGSYWPSTCECMPGYLNGACHCIPCEIACPYDSPEKFGTGMASSKEYCLGSEYGCPPPPSTTTTTIAFTYSYTADAWSSCSASCGGGTQTRSVTCQQFNPMNVGRRQLLQPGAPGSTPGAPGSVVSDSYCSGTKPSTSQSCNTQECYTYYYGTGAWLSCSASCGGGTQTRSVTCKRSDDQSVSDSYCSDTKPSTSQSCNTQECSTYFYNRGAWSSCSTSCGGGTQTRSVTCKRSDGQSVSDSYCSGTKPSTSQSCNTQECYTYSYTTDAWSSCSTSCGGGTQTRSVTCTQSDGQSVSDSYCSDTKPSTSQSCNTQACASSTSTTAAPTLTTAAPTTAAPTTTTAAPTTAAPTPTTAAPTPTTASPTPTTSATTTLAQAQQADSQQAVALASTVKLSGYTVSSFTNEARRIFSESVAEKMKVKPDQVIIDSVSASATPPDLSSLLPSTGASHRRAMLQQPPAAATTSGIDVAFRIAAYEDEASAKAAETVFQDVIESGSLADELVERGLDRVSISVVTYNIVININSPAPSPSSSGDSGGGTAAGAAGGAVAALIILGGAWLVRRRMQQRQEHPDEKSRNDGGGEESPSPPTSQTTTNLTVTATPDPVAKEGKHTQQQNKKVVDDDEEDDEDVAKKTKKKEEVKKEENDDDESAIHIEIDGERIEGSIVNTTSQSADGGGGDDTKKKDLKTWLAEHSLGQFEDKLREYGAVDVSDLRDLDDSELNSIGFKRLDKKRLKTALEHEEE